MASMIDKLEFSEHQGSVKKHDLALYALSTCAFCKKAMRFLQDHDVTFRYVYLDTINPMVKRTVKSELKTRYASMPIFPVLVIDDKESLSGFSEEKWKESLGID